MKPPKRITSLLKRKQEYIDKQRNVLEKSVLKLQNDLLSRYLGEIIPKLDVKDGVILDTDNNYRRLADMDKVYKEFTQFSSSVVSKKMAEAIGGIGKLTSEYFSVVVSESVGKRFAKVVSEAARKMDLRIGLSGGEMVRGGFLETFLKDTTLSTQIKTYVSRSITGQIDTKDFIKGLTNIVHGDKGPGALEKQYQRYAYDIYQQYDRAYSSSLAEEFEMNYFIYQGGLIDDSRDFCAAHNNKVWTRQEAGEWPEWTPSKGEYPTGYEVKQKDIYSVPSYMNYPGYQPLIDAGGYNCRHSIGWISDELAFELRPELKENVNKE